MPVEDADGELVREVYARFGLALYRLQVLEHGLVNALLTLMLLPTAKSYEVSSDWEKAVDDFFDEKFEKTFGNIIREFERVDAFPEDLLKRAKKSKADRDFLAHRFFRSYAEQLMSKDGKLEMISICHEISETAHKLDADIEGFLRPIQERHGLSNEMIDAEVSRFESKQSKA